MYLLLKDEEKIIVNSVAEMEKYDVSQYEIYALAPIDKSILFENGTIRDTICEVLKGNQIPKDQVVQRVQDTTGSTIMKINKLISQMKKEKLIYLVDDLWDSAGRKWIGME